MRSAPFALFLAAALSFSATAQTTDPDAPEDPNATPQAEGTEAAAAEEPAFNGRATGRFIAADINVPVVCTGMNTGTLTAQSDPGDTPSEDTNGDGTVVNITAATSGQISMNMLAGDISLDFSDTVAKVEGNVIRYAITASITGGVDERIDLTINCN